MRPQYPLTVCLLSAVLLAASCIRKSVIPIHPPPSSSNQLPAISGASPAEGPLGTTVTITGSGFNTTPTLDTVYFNGKQAAVTSATATQLVVTVPAQAGTGIITVNVQGNTVNGPLFTYDYQYYVSTLAGGNTNLVDGTALMPVLACSI